MIIIYQLKKFHFVMNNTKIHYLQLLPLYTRIEWTDEICCWNPQFQQCVLDCQAIITYRLNLYRAVSSIWQRDGVNAFWSNALLGTNVRLNVDIWIAVGISPKEIHFSSLARVFKRISSVWMSEGAVTYLFIYYDLFQ